MNLTALTKKTVNYFLRFRNIQLYSVNHSPSSALSGIANLDIQSVIDIGSNSGQFIESISHLFPFAKIFCFEPLPQEYERLKISIQNLGISRRTKAFNFALGDKDMCIPMNTHTQHSPSSSLLKSTSICANIFPQTVSQSQIYTEMKLLDSVLENELNDDSLNKCLIKIDVQGYEKNVLLGASRVLKYCSALIVEINVAELYHGQPNFSEIHDIALENNLHYAGVVDQVCDSNGEILYFDAIFLRK